MRQSSQKPKMNKWVLASPIFDSIWQLKTKNKQMNYTLLKEWKSVLIRGMFILLVFNLMTACSVESKLNKNFKGKSFLEVMAVKGAPTNIENLVGGGTVRIYIKKEMLKEAPINTGQFQYDKFNSPKVLKTEITEFYVDPDGIVKNVKYSSEFSK